MSHLASSFPRYCSGEAYPSVPYEVSSVFLDVAADAEPKSTRIIAPSVFLIIRFAGFISP